MPALANNVTEATLLVVAGIIIVFIASMAIWNFKCCPLKPHFRRLGQIAPADLCPCREGRESGNSYEVCCRRKDIARLEDDLKGLAIRNWGHRTSVGRYEMPQSLPNRLAVHRVGKFALPKWVLHPEQFTFPIDRETLKNWGPNA